MHSWLHALLNVILCASLERRDPNEVWYQSGFSVDVNYKCMITREKLQIGEGKLKSFDPKANVQNKEGKWKKKMLGWRKSEIFARPFAKCSTRLKKFLQSRWGLHWGSNTIPHAFILGDIH